MATEGVSYDFFLLYYISYFSFTIIFYQCQITFLTHSCYKTFKSLIFNLVVIFFLGFKQKQDPENVHVSSTERFDTLHGFGRILTRMPERKAFTTQFINRPMMAVLFGNTLILPTWNFKLFRLCLCGFSLLIAIFFV